ncbi:unnamed protein product [Sympodiomycopsis kandeliae]
MNPKMKVHDPNHAQAVGLQLQLRLSGNHKILQTINLSPKGVTSHTIGRGTQPGQTVPSEIALSKVISRKHAEITYAPSLLQAGPSGLLFDCGSSHGTELHRQGTRTTVKPLKNVRIYPGDVIKIGKDLNKDGLNHKPLYCYVNRARIQDPTPGSNSKTNTNVSPFKATSGTKSLGDEIIAGLDRIRDEHLSRMSSKGTNHIKLTLQEQLDPIEISDDEDNGDKDDLVETSASQHPTSQHTTSVPAEQFSAIESDNDPTEANAAEEAVAVAVDSAESPSTFSDDNVGVNDSDDDAAQSGVEGHSSVVDKSEAESQSASDSEDNVIKENEAKGNCDVDDNQRDAVEETDDQQGAESAEDAVDTTIEVDEEAVESVDKTVEVDEEAAGAVERPEAQQGAEAVPDAVGKTSELDKTAEDGEEAVIDVEDATSNYSCDDSDDEYQGNETQDVLQELEELEAEALEADARGAQKTLEPKSSKNMLLCTWLESKMAAEDDSFEMPREDMMDLIAELKVEARRQEAKARRNKAENSSSLCTSRESRSAARALHASQEPVSLSTKESTEPAHMETGDGAALLGTSGTVIEQQQSEQPANDNAHVPPHEDQQQDDFFGNLFTFIDDFDQDSVANVPGALCHSGAEEAAAEPSVPVVDGQETLADSTDDSAPPAEEIASDEPRGVKRPLEAVDADQEKKTSGATSVESELNSSLVTIPGAPAASAADTLEITPGSLVAPHTAKRQRTKDILIGAAVGAVSTFVSLAYFGASVTLD